MSLKLLKTIRSHAGHARFLAECDGHDSERWEDCCFGYLPRCLAADIPSPYAYSASWPLYRWNGKRVLVRETSHRCYQVFEVPATVKTFATDDAATEYHIRMTRAA